MRPRLCSEAVTHESVSLGAIEWLDSEDVFLRNQAVVILRSRNANVIPHLEQAFRTGDGDRRICRRTCYGIDRGYHQLRNHYDQ